MGWLALAISLIGFSKTFFLPLAEGTFKASPLIYLHGACAFSWVALFALQPVLIRARRFREHRIAGLAACLAAAGFVVTALPVGALAAARDAAGGGGEAAVSGIVGVFTSALMFSGLVVAGVIKRKSAETHKRLMLLATILVLWPAWFRLRHYFPDVPRPDIIFAVVLADSLIVVAALRDLIVRKAIHPVWLTCGTALIAEQIAEVVMFDSPNWRSFARFLFGVFGPSLPTL